MRERLDNLSFEQKREVLEALQAQFTLEKGGDQLRILLVLPAIADISSTTLLRASGYTAQGRIRDGVTLSRTIDLAEVDLRRSELGGD